MGKLVLFVAFLCSFLSHSQSLNSGHTSEVQLNRIKQCLDQALSAKNWRKKSADPFHLHFGDPAVEILNLLSQHDVKRVIYLNECVKSEVPELYETHSIGEDTSSYDALHLGVGNITHITGIYQHFLSDIHERLVRNTKDVFHDLDWHGYIPIDEVGIRSVRIVSESSGINMPNKEEKEEARRKAIERKKNFIIAPHPKTGPYVPENDPHSDVYVGKRMHIDEDSVYTVYVLLSSKEKYYGGNLLVQKVQKSDDNEEYDEDEEEEESSSSVGKDSSEVNEEVNDQKTVRHEDMIIQEEHVRDNFDEGVHSLEDEQAFAASSSGDEDKFSIAKATIARFGPDDGCALVVRGDARHGVQEVRRGTMMYLVVELWKYEDVHETGVVGRRRAPASAGLKLFQKKSAHGSEL